MPRHMRMPAGQLPTTLSPARSLCGHSGRPVARRRQAGQSGHCAGPLADAQIFRTCRFQSSGEVKQCARCACFQAKLSHVSKTAVHVQHCMRNARAGQATTGACTGARTDVPVACFGRALGQQQLQLVRAHRQVDAGAHRLVLPQPCARVSHIRV